MGIWVGIDIAKQVHWATAVDDAARWCWTGGCPMTRLRSRS